MDKKEEKIKSGIFKLIGNTPIIKLNRLVEYSMADVLVKLESYNPGGSVKDRIALSMINAAEKDGLLKAGGTIVEPTSGNTGIGLAIIAAVKGYRCILTMPESMSIERSFLCKILGAEIVLTPSDKGMIGAIEKASEIASEIEGSFIPQQFRNLANPEIHRKTTAVEILEAVDGKLDAFVAGIGTGGTITGVGEILKKMNPKIKIIGFEPAFSPLLGEGRSGHHKIHGIGAGFKPEVLNIDIIDEIQTVNDRDAFDMVKQLASNEGVLAGISSGAAVFVALNVAKKLGKGKRVLAILPDNCERYHSMEKEFI